MTEPPAARAEPIEPPSEVRTAYLARYDDFEADIVLDILRDAGIFCYAKAELEENEHFVYNPAVESDRGVIMVDATRLDDAKGLIAAQLPAHLESIRQAMRNFDEQEPPSDGA